VDTRIPKTEAWKIESPKASYAQGVWTLKCGGSQMPEFTIIEPDLEDAIFELVKAVTRDAIEDEARAWLNVKTQQLNRA
jgi:hypothetical protein